MTEHNIFLDIETIPTQSEAVRQRLRDEITPPGNITKPESREKWLANNAEAKAAEAIAKTGFDPAYGHVCCIGWAIDDGPTLSENVPRVSEEHAALSDFFHQLPSMHRLTFVGHNVAAFDLRFLMCRAVVLGVKVPPEFPRDPKPWGGPVFDTMHAWAGTRGTISLDKLCEALDLPAKGDFDGSMVADAWAAGEHVKIANYCKRDVENVRKIWRKFHAAGLT